MSDSASRALSRVPPRLRARVRVTILAIPRPVRRLTAWARSDDALLTAASLSFYALMSAPPMVLLAFAAVAATVGDDQLRHVSAQLQHVLPQQLQAAHFLPRMADLASHLGWVSAITAVWPATWYGSGLARALDRIGSPGDRPFDGIRGRLLGLVFLVLLPIVVLLALLVSFLAPGLLGSGALGYVAGLVIGAAVAVLLVAVLVGILYRLFSPAQVPLRYTVHGALVAAGLVAVLSAGFVVYLRLGADYGSRYATGSLAAAALFALWIYLVHTAVLTGYRSSVVRAGAVDPETANTEP